MITEDRLRAIIHQSGTHFPLAVITLNAVDASVEFLNDDPIKWEDQRINLICGMVTECEEHILSREPQPLE